MYNMFKVRSVRALAPSLESVPPRARRLRRRGPTPSHLPESTSRPASHALLSTRQEAKAFNQPLSFDTSSVTDMHAMFFVRSARALAPNLESGHAPVHAACAAAPRPHASRPAPRLASYTLLSARQNAVAFNQPLSFDTSKVANMAQMFNVRSARALCPQP